jgi:hypothetical protein
MMNRRACKLCKDPVYGRKDKVFCSVTCKAEYHKRLKEVTSEATRQTDKILHRNRSILLEILGKKRSRLSIPKQELAVRNFKFHYLTGLYENNRGKRYNLVYDFAWTEFSSGEVLIVRRKI